ncbi:hypothetical protein [Kitasatospora azatica]|uniref:hypothetical protein n=1 Tax=Kitasatospora azatica TaxID=58347 RepID=UPI0012F759D1|nr:hypothetical protein [Kitasatospora azatica]
MQASDNRLQVNLIAETSPDRLTSSDGKHKVTLANWRQTNLYDVHIRVDVSAPPAPSLQISGTAANGAMIRPQGHRCEPFDLKKQPGINGSHQISTDADWSDYLDTSGTLGSPPPKRFSRHCDTVIDVG